MFDVSNALGQLAVLVVVLSLAFRLTPTCCRMAPRRNRAPAGRASTTRWSSLVEHRGPGSVAG